MTPAYGLPATTLEKIRSILIQHPEVSKAVLYGSRAKGNYKNGSDIDLTLHGRDLTPETLAQIADELDNLLLPYTIDLSIFEQLTDADFIEHIQRVGSIFYEKQPLASSVQEPR